MDNQPIIDAVSALALFPTEGSGRGVGQVGKKRTLQIRSVLHQNASDLTSAFRIWCSTFANGRFAAVGSTGHHNTFCSLSAGVSKSKIFRGRWLSRRATAFS